MQKHTHSWATVSKVYICQKSIARDLKLHNSQTKEVFITGSKRLLRCCRERQLEHALLLYFASQFHMGHQALQEYIKASLIGDEDTDEGALRTTLARLSYLLYEKDGWP